VPAEKAGFGSAAAWSPDEARLAFRAGGAPTLITQDGKARRILEPAAASGNRAWTFVPIEVAAGKERPRWSYRSGDGGIYSPS
jgi:hypothetical protein